MRSPNAIAVAALLWVSPGTGIAQSQPSRLEPAATVQAFWNAVFDMRWEEAVGYLELGDLDWARRLQIEGTKLRPGREYTVADLMRRDPDMPREAAEYEVRRREKLRAQYPERPFRNYFGVDSAAQLERMPLEEVAARWIQSRDPLWLLQEQRRKAQCPPSPAADSLKAARRATVYGASMAGDTAYVLFKADWVPVPDFPAEIPQVWMPKIAVLRRGPSGWRIRALETLVEGAGGLFGMADCPRDGMKRSGN